jgi:UDP-N-acetylmuramate dehydrogenase
MLREYTSLRVGGPAKRLLRVESHDELIEAVKHLGDTSEDSLLVLGSGTNVVVSDDGFDGTVLILAGGEIRADVTSAGTECRFVIDAGVSWDTFVTKAVELGCSGVEMMSGIPGCVGAAPMQNIAAYGQQVCDVIESVEAIDRSSVRTELIPAEECAFEFRSSRFQTEWSGRFLITRVHFRLKSAAEAPPAPSEYVDIQRYFDQHNESPIDVNARRQAVLDTRHTKSMLLDANDPDARGVGSFFVNPSVTTEIARALAERFDTMKLRVDYLEGKQRQAAAGRQRVPAAYVLRWSGFNPGDRWGPIKLSRKHVLALVTTPGASATDVWNVGNYIRERVHEDLGFYLDFEPTFVGRFPEFERATFDATYPCDRAPAIEPTWLTSYR